MLKTGYFCYNIVVVVVYGYKRKCDHCFLFCCRGAVGETTFHVCFLMGTPTHMFCAKRMLKWYPKLLNDIYLSEVT